MFLLLYGTIPSTRGQEPCVKASGEDNKTQGSDTIAQPRQKKNFPLGDRNPHLECKSLRSGRVHDASDAIESVSDLLQFLLDYCFDIPPMNNSGETFCDF